MRVPLCSSVQPTRSSSLQVIAREAAPPEYTTDFMRPRRLHSAGKCPDMVVFEDNDRDVWISTTLGPLELSRS